MNKEILIFGKGWIGTRLADFLNCNSTNKRILTYEDVQGEIDKFKPKVIINAIGSFGKNVDDCEINKTKTITANTFVPLILGEAALRNKIKLVHISSGCIFHYDYEKNRPLQETEAPDYYDLFYSRTKEYAESGLLALGDAANILIVRPRMPLDYISHPRNLLDKLISFPSVIDLENSVTYVPDFLEAVKHLIKIDACGVFNTVNYGGLRFKELLEIYRTFKNTHSYSITSQTDLKIARTNLVLSTDKLEETGFNVRDIHDCLYECVDKWIRIQKGELDVKTAVKAEVKEPGVIFHFPTEGKLA